MFFWVFPRHQIVVGRRFGTLCQFHLQRLGVEYDTGFRTVDQLQFDAEEIPKRTYTTIMSVSVSCLSYLPRTAHAPYYTANLDLSGANKCVYCTS